MTHLETIMARLADATRAKDRAAGATALTELYAWMREQGVDPVWLAAPGVASLEAEPVPVAVPVKHWEVMGSVYLAASLDLTLEAPTREAAERAAKHRVLHDTEYWQELCADASHHETCIESVRELLAP